MPHPRADRCGGRTREFDAELPAGMGAWRLGLWQAMLPQKRAG